MASFRSNATARQGRIELLKIYPGDPAKLQGISLAKLILCYVTVIGILLETNLTSAAPFAAEIISNEETKSSSNETQEGVFSDSLQIASPELNYSASLSQGPVMVGGDENETLEYQAEMILHCKVMGRSATNVTWEYNDKPMSFKRTTIASEGTGDEEAAGDQYSDVIGYVPEEQTTQTTTERIDDNRVRVSKTDEKNAMVGIPVGDDDSSENKIIPANSDGKTNSRKIRVKTTWVDIQLPKLNMALYGKFTCKAVNEEGVSVKEYVIVPNANSSVFMKLVRTCVALCILAAFVGIFRLLTKHRLRRKLLKYEKLPDEDRLIIRRFQNGIQTSGGCGISTLPKCVTAVSTMTNESTETPNTPSNALKINTWVNIAAYDDRKELAKDFFEIDADSMHQCNSYGKIMDGKIRSVKTLTWKKVSVKMRNPEVSEEGKQLEGLLTELKVLLSIMEPHQFIVNLHGAYTKKLYKRQVYLFLDSCKLGHLNKYLETHYSSFIDKTRKSSSNHISGLEAGINDTPKTEQSNGNGPKGPGPEVPSTSTDCPISVLSLMIWSTQIACGLKFLHKHNILHGNLSTENVFLTQDFAAKLGNIGHTPIWSSSSQEKNTVPLPPECRRTYNEYTFKSDSWMFGSILWEMFSLRQGNLPSNQEIIDFYAFGKTFNTEALHSPKEINELMYLCWNPQDDMRPDAEYLFKSLEAILQLEVDVSAKQQTTDCQ